MRHLLWPLLLFVHTRHVAAAVRRGGHCFDACDLTLTYLDFNDTDRALSKKSRTCQSALHATSLYLCIDEHCVEDGREEWLDGVNGTCQNAAGISIPPWTIIDTFTPEDRAHVRRLKAEEGMWYSRGPPLNEVVLPDDDFFDRAFKTLEFAFFEIDTHWLYGIAMYYFWAAVITIGICWRLAFLIQEIRHRNFQRIPGDDLELEDVNGRKGAQVTLRAYGLLKRYILVPATFGYRCAQNIGWCTIPPRVQSLTIFAFVILNLILCCISYPVFAGNLYWPLVSTQLWRYVSDRTGVIALANFPLIWLFGTRNNVLMWLTGWGFGTYNSFHRWVARVATVQAVVHSVGYTEMVFERGNWSLFMKYLRKHYFWNGEIATVLMCAICACSVYGLRRCHYEIFLVTHIFLSIIVLLTTFYHVEIFNGEWNIFIWPCLAIWILDRALRLLRILAFNRIIWNTYATATYDSTSNIVRLKVPCEQNLVRPQPGAYYYIYVLNDLLFAHQNHPFTLAYMSSNDGADSTDGIHISRHCRADSTTSSVSSESSSLLRPTSPRSPTLTFLIRPYDGLTSRLRRICTSASRTSVRVLVEGPYGAQQPLHTFPSVLFIAGGTGIAVALSYLPSLLREDGESEVVDVHLVWAVREQALWKQVLQTDIPSMVLRDDRFRVTVHVTKDVDDGGKDADDAIDSSHIADRRYDQEVIGHVEAKGGRPNVSAAVEDAAQEVGRAGRLAVVACGPAQMADEARRACVGVLGAGYTGVEYFEESFKW
ncbi:uncharacterized protein EI97DRAFT_413032 [Westerdykella ornata]|uniref:FAD-binding FR-type domain-containing protein n=1 Tax=Westerdykella ornata TaxID=318751 RepID=A0A6A6JV97_WESOR|nr:uncharacterized protein EI97DRAFT_413032 [Westerdykella ornata]KAF2279748.1 hypothetical protein EI97DRAFT_413032 [Westerdykella ornata]